MIQFNLLLITFLAIFGISSIFRWGLKRINISHLRKLSHHVPEFFKEEIDGKTLSKMTDYTVDSSRFTSIASVFNDIVILVILLSGFLPWLIDKILTFNLHFILSGFIFFGLLALIKGILDIPFSLYDSFAIEKNYGFSTITPKLWASDLLKSLLVSAILMAILLCPLLGLICYAKNTWWLWVWMLFISFQLLVLWLYPLIIAPLFNKYEPIEDHNLKERIFSIAKKAGIEISGIYQVDAGKRSKHTNAYFTGIGKTKRIVLYDTLLKSHTTEEILSVLAHEIGHLKKRHIIKHLMLTQSVSFFALYIAYRLIEWPVIYKTFGFEESIPYVGLLLLAVLFKPISFFFTPVWSMISRKFEKEADDYSWLLLKTTRPLCSALRQLAKDNLANLHPHPLFAWFYYSHHPLTERIARLQGIEKE